jgi:hypothetical protein
MAALSPPMPPPTTRMDSGPGRGVSMAQGGEVYTLRRSAVQDKDLGLAAEQPVVVMAAAEVEPGLRREGGNRGDGVLADGELRK